jgi:hypothetical protein
MPVDQWYDADTREAATARVLERRATKPNDRNVLMVVAEEFGVAQQTLRAWVEEAAPETATPARKPRPKFSQVVTRRIVPEEAPPEPEVEAEGDDVSEEAPSASADEVTEEAPPALTPDVTDEPAQQQPSPAAEEAPPATAPEVAADEDDEDEPRTAASSPAPAGAIAALEAEAATLRAHNEALKQAMRVLLDD